MLDFEPAKVKLILDHLNPILQRQQIDYQVSIYLSEPLGSQQPDAHWYHAEKPL